MNKQQIVKTSVASDLEISDLEGGEHLELQDTSTQKEILCKKRKHPHWKRRGTMVLIKRG